MSSHLHGSGYITASPTFASAIVIIDNLAHPGSIPTQYYTLGDSALIYEIAAFTVDPSSATLANAAIVSALTSTSDPTLDYAITFDAANRQMIVLDPDDISIAGGKLPPYKLVHTMTITGSILGHSVAESFDLEIINPCNNATTSQILFSGDTL